MSILSLSINEQQLAIFKQAAALQHISLDDYLKEMMMKNAELEKERLEREDWNRRFLELVSLSTLDIGEITWKRENLYDR